MNNEKRTTEATLTLAGNGYVLNMQDDEVPLVYEGTTPPDGIGRKLLSDLYDLIEYSENRMYKITVTIEPI